MNKCIYVKKCKDKLSKIEIPAFSVKLIDFGVLQRLKHIKPLTFIKSTILFPFILHNFKSILLYHMLYPFLTFLQKNYFNLRIMSLVSIFEEGSGLVDVTYSFVSKLSDRCFIMLMG